MSGIIEVDNLTFGYAFQETVLKNVSFSVKQGTFLAIAGPNGAGKTTLLNLLCGLLSPRAGSIKIDARPIESYSIQQLAQEVAIVRQEFVPVFDFTVVEVVSMARTPYLGTFGFESKIDRDIVDDALEATDTRNFALRPLGSLSAGERQRVFIARALAQDTPILLLDEPTSFLDLKHQVGIYDLLRVAQLEKGKTVLTVTHDINLAAQYCDEVLLLKAAPANNKCLIGKTKDVLSSEQIERTFGVRVLEGKVKQEKFFIPLGRFAKDCQQTDFTSENRQEG
jgi:iron complex transport system ATP-binding protein